jgi:hypothetical protein
MKTLTEYSEKMANEFKVALATKEFQDAVNKDLASSNGEFEVVASMATPDRIGDVVKVEGWDFKNYKKNPVILWGHDYSIPPIGKATEWSIEGNKLIMKGIFASNEFAQQVRKDYEAGFQKAVSVGFISKKRNETDFDIIEEAELLELSFVAVGMHPDAIDNLKKTFGEAVVSRMLAKDIITLDAEIEEPSDDEEPVETPEEPTEEPTDEPEEPETPEEPVDGGDDAEKCPVTGEDECRCDDDEEPEDDDEELSEEGEKIFKAVMKAIKCANHDDEGAYETRPEDREDHEEDEDEDPSFDEMNDEEKAIFMADLKSMLQKTVGEAQNTLRDWKRKENGTDDDEEDEDEETEE